MSQISFKGVEFGFTALSDEELCLDFFVNQDAPASLKSLPHDALDASDIPDLESYLSANGFDIETVMENCAAVLINDTCNDTFAELNDVVKRITYLLEEKGGTVLDRFEDDPEASIVFCDLAESFQQNPALLNA